jgi:AcrR family transcriptional regulator
MRAWNDSLRPALRAQRPDLDDGQVELMLWSIQSMIASTGRGTFHAPMAERVPAVRAGLQALTLAELVPTGGPAAPHSRRMWPHSMRERLILAAIQQFGERGFQDTSMASLGAAVDVTGANLYSYFESKAELVRAVFDRGSHALWIDLDHALAGSANPTEAVGKLTRSYIARAHSWASNADDPRGEHGRAANVVTFRQEYIAEWVALLVEADPALSPRTARLRVRLALFLIADLYSNRRIVELETFQENLARLALAVLFHAPADAS